MKDLRLRLQHLVLLLAHLVSVAMPHSRCFRARRLLFLAAGLKIGKRTSIEGGASFHSPQVRIGEETFISKNTHFFSSGKSWIVIGDRVDIAPGCLICTGTHRIANIQRRAGIPIDREVRVGNGSWLCMGGMLLPGTTIGEGSIVAAGAVARGNYPPNVVIGGVPAVIVKAMPPLGMEEFASLEEWIGTADCHSTGT